MKLKVFGHEVFIDERLILYPSADEVRRQIDEYLRGKRKEFEVVVDYSKLPSDLARLMKALQRVKYGTTITYGELGKRIEMHPRKVGKMCAKNPLPILVPCHRVVGSRGIGGYSYGVELKKKLLGLEEQHSR